MMNTSKSIAGLKVVGKRDKEIDVLKVTLCSICEWIGRRLGSKYPTTEHILVPVKLARASITICIITLIVIKNLSQEICFAEATTH